MIALGRQKLQELSMECFPFFVNKNEQARKEVWF